MRGIEVDHDCATAALAGYADWLERERAALEGELSLSITALPTWSGSPALPRLASLPDHVVLQVHAVRAPTLFTAGQARGFVEAWARVTDRPFQVALPTYRVRLRDGTPLSAEPREVARFLAALRERPVAGVSGLVWFRLGHRGDAEAWSLPTLTAVVRGEPLVPRFLPRLVDAGGGTLDIVLENTGHVDAEAPTRLSLRQARGARRRGGLRRAGHLTRGAHASPPARWRAPRHRLRSGLRGGTCSSVRHWPVCPCWAC
ncbi:DUF3142 domain-containing protein [Cystobacter fuscus]